MYSIKHIQNLNNRQKINFFIIVVLILIDILVILTEKQRIYPFNNIVVVCSINIFLIGFYELWQLKDIYLSYKEKTILKLLVVFLKDEGYDENKVLSMINPYFKSYSKKQVVKQIKSTNTKKYYINPIYWKSRQYKIYVLFIILDILYQNRIRDKVSEKKLKKLSKLLTSNSEHFLLIDYHFKTKGSKSDNKSFTYKLWNAYKTLGILPDNNNLVLEKASKLSALEHNKKEIDNFIKYINLRNREVSDLYFYSEKNSLIIIKIVWFNLSLLSVLLNLIPYFISPVIILLILGISIPSSDGYTYKRPTEKFKTPDYSEILKAELIANFFFDRYKVSESRISSYVLHYTKRITREEANIIIKEKKSLNKICSLINESSFSKNAFLTTLFDIAAADKVFSDKEDSYINQVAEYLQVEKKEVKKIRDQYLRRGVTEKKTRQKTYNYKSSSSSMVSYYSSKAYKILGIEKTASADEIKKAYRALAMKHHPDKFATKGEDAMEQAEEKFQEITDAYELIKRLKNIN